MSLDLYCFPPAGARASMYVRWVDIVAPSVRIIPMEFPGHGFRMKETLSTSIAQLVDTLSAELAGGLHRRFAMFGHSMGAIVAFEVTREILKSSNRLPVHLFVSGCAAPQLLPSRDAIHHLPEEEFVSSVMNLGGTPDGIFQEPELLKIMVPVLRADFSAFETYVFRRSIDLTCPITSFVGSEDKLVTYAQGAAWRSCTTGTFAIHTLAGDHFFLESSRASLLGYIGRTLSKI